MSKFEYKRGHVFQETLLETSRRVKDAYSELPSDSATQSRKPKEAAVRQAEQRHAAVSDELQRRKIPLGAKFFATRMRIAEFDCKGEHGQITIFAGLTPASGRSSDSFLECLYQRQYWTNRALGSDRGVQTGTDHRRKKNIRVGKNVRNQ